MDYSKQMQNGFQFSFQFVCDEINKVTELDVSSYIAQNLYLDAIIYPEEYIVRCRTIIKKNLRKWEGFAWIEA